MKNLAPKWLIPALLLLPVSVFAETTTYDVAGMTCSSCVKMIKATVCKTEGVEKCDVSIGKVVITTKPGTTIDEQKIKEAVVRAGDYKVTGSSTKK